MPVLWQQTIYAVLPLVGCRHHTVSGGAAPYTYNWSNGSTNEDLTGVLAGNYSVTVTDGNGCMVVGNYTVTNDAGTLAQTYGNAVDEVCGQSNGSIDIIITGGVQPYTYSWTNGATTEDLVGIPAGSYQCTITDANNCSIMTPVYVINNDGGTLSLDLVDVDDEECGNGLGDITLTVSGGTLPYSFAWNTGDTTQNLDSLSAGTYSATITDSAGCSVSTGNLTVINQPGTLALTSISATDEICGNMLGGVDVEVSGGTAPLTYSWNNGSTSEDINGVSAGNYTVTVTDVNGCSISANATVANDPGTLAIDNIIITDESCGQVDGALDLIISGHTNPVSYLWSNGATSQDLSGIAAGTYTVDVTDANGCMVSGNATVNNNSGNFEFRQCVPSPTRFVEMLVAQLTSQFPEARRRSALAGTTVLPLRISQDCLPGHSHVPLLTTQDVL